MTKYDDPSGAETGSERSAEKPRSGRFLVLLSLAVLVVVGVGVVGLASVWLRPIRMGDGVWRLTTSKVVVFNRGGEMRVWTTLRNDLARRELDENVDGMPELRGDDWRGKDPWACWKREADEWVVVARDICGDALQRMYGY